MLTVPPGVPVGDLPSLRRVVQATSKSVGSGFGGLFGTKKLRRPDVEVTMIAKTTHHLFHVE
jgi:hypothetical protein